MGITFNLESILEELEITKNHLAVETKTRPATVLDLSRGKVKRVDIETLSSLLDHLNSVARERGMEKTYTIDSILPYHYNEENHQF
ncbi:helix-turn-helix domain-containing protein [Bacillus infantis]|uniref:helix-turn-helix domain-containing protein n=1 Tax=Bacillus infantis TaxID=324767 RepID=UPI003CE7344F